MYEYKIYGTDGNLMLIKMLKVLFPYTKITDQKNSVDRKNNITHLKQVMHTTNGSMQDCNNKYDTVSLLCQAIDQHYWGCWNLRDYKC